MTKEIETPRRSKRADAAGNRQRIVEAAREVFAIRGLDAEVKEIAARAGVGVGTLYRHFGSREGLVAVMLEQTKEELRTRLTAAAESDDPASAVRAMIRAGTEACEQFGALTEALLGGRLDQFKDGGHKGLVEPLVDVLQRGIKEGVFRPDLDPRLAMVMLKSVFSADVLLVLAPDRAYSRVADAIADFFLRAIRR